MVAVVVAATIATALAYSGMVLFGLEVAHMTTIEAYGLAGFLEVSLVAVALMARNAALEGRPYGVLLTLTWVLSGTSGLFAALHQIAVPDASTPYMVAFRFVPPLVAALMWHLALVGERHLVTGHTLDERRREHRVHEYVGALELWRDARVDSAGDRTGMRKVQAAHQRQRAARDSALRMLTVEDFERRMQVWVERLEAAERHGNRLDRIGASSVKRGKAAGAEELPVPAAVYAVAPAAPSPVARAWAESTADVAVAAPVEADDVTVLAEPEPFAEAFEEALAAETTVDEDTMPEPVEAEVAEVAAPVEPIAVREPLPETGHTRRVELFDLARNSEAAMGGAAAARSAFFTAHGAPASAVSAVDAPASLATEDAESAAAPSQAASDRDQTIVELAAEGLTQREIAERVSASPTTVGRVLRSLSTTARASK
ncbi:hypothetical protein [Xylanimonas sp. McL0601]|uniref:hypothetical protein n=1 Tax=Xylanimonas sp. McL0601 TaxID=3414739 RepID=UPI003CF1E08D